MVDPKALDTVSTGRKGWGGHLLDRFQVRGLSSAGSLRACLGPEIYHNTSYNPVARENDGMSGVASEVSPFRRFVKVALRAMFLSTAAFCFAAFALHAAELPHISMENGTRQLLV